MIKDFIKNNGLSFGEGSRNSTVTILVGYAQHLGLNLSELEKELSFEIKEDKFIGDEINRLWDYCKVKNYRKFWKTKEAKDLYKF